MVPCKNRRTQSLYLPRVASDSKPCPTGTQSLSPSAPLIFGNRDNHFQTFGMPAIALFLVAACEERNGSQPNRKKQPKKKTRGKKKKRSNPSARSNWVAGPVTIQPAPSLREPMERGVWGSQKRKPGPGVRFWTPQTSTQGFGE